MTCSMHGGLRAEEVSRRGDRDRTVVCFCGACDWSGDIVLAARVVGHKAAYRPSFVSRVRSFTFAKIASCVTRGMPSQIADAATQRSAS